MRSQGEEMISNEKRSSLSEHILPNSSMMIGVCMTVISIIKLVGLHGERRQIAEFISLDSVLFMASALLSYFAMRHKGTAQTSFNAERTADVIFMVGLLVMTANGLLLAYEIF
jgi:hypothetical protein